MFAEDGEDDAETVELVDPESGRRLRVGIEYQFEFEGIQYFMCFPADDPVVIAYEEDDGMHEFEEEEELREMFPVAERALANENILLKDTAYWWTVDDLGEIDRNEEKEEDADDEGEVLADFQFKGRQYSVVQPVFAVYMIVREGANGFVPIEGEELERVSAAAEQVWLDKKPEN